MVLIPRIELGSDRYQRPVITIILYQLKSSMGSYSIMCFKIIAFNIAIVILCSILKLNSGGNNMSFTQFE